jgi:predicted unusual protein kinase regulating ubiquinone biosynthesis (AarF/ABC1/UbiB family)
MWASFLNEQRRASYPGSCRRGWISRSCSTRRAQLHAEADYRRETGHIATFRTLLDDSLGFALPEVVGALSGDDILCMTFVPGAPVESVAGCPPAERDRVVRSLFTLLFRELFEFGLVQSDPNFANYRYDAATGTLDFGATRTYGPPIVAAYRDLMTAGIAGEHAAVEAAALQDGRPLPARRPARRAGRRSRAAPCARRRRPGLNRRCVAC